MLALVQREKPSLPPWAAISASSSLNIVPRPPPQERRPAGGSRQASANRWASAPLSTWGRECPGRPDPDTINHPGVDARNAHRNRHAVAGGYTADQVYGVGRECAVLAVEIHGIETRSRGVLDGLRAGKRQSQHQRLQPLSILLQNGVLDHRKRASVSRQLYLPNR